VLSTDANSEGQSAGPIQRPFVPDWIWAVAFMVFFWMGGILVGLLAGLAVWAVLRWVVRYYFKVDATTLVVRRGLRTTTIPLDSIQSISLRSFPTWSVRVNASNPDQSAEITGRQGGGISAIEQAKGVAANATLIAKAAGFPADQQTLDPQQLADQAAGRALIGSDGYTLATLHR